MKKQTKKKEEKTKKSKIDYEGMWKGMPAFKQEEIKTHKTIQVHFMTNEDMLRFSKLVGQVVGFKTRSIYFPEQKAETAMDKRWSDKKKK